MLTDYACRHIFTRGFLARVQTIHFAHWVFLDDKRRLVFVSNYDGSHQGYMDDFINKVGWGLNLLFSNGVGWPRTRWLVAAARASSRSSSTISAATRCRRRSGTRPTPGSRWSSSSATSASAKGWSRRR